MTMMAEVFGLTADEIPFMNDATKSLATGTMLEPGWLLVPRA